MILYHGTTQRRARRIAVEGFLPRKPSRRVWFAHSKAYAEGRARTQARRGRDRSAVLTCDIDLPEFRRRLGPKRIFHRSGIVAIDGPVPATVLRSFPGLDSPSTPKELCHWVNTLLDVKPHKGVGSKHPGIQRLARWVANRLNSRPNSTIKTGELIEVARQWLPDVFAGIEIDPERLTAYRRAQPTEMDLLVHAPPPEPREARALELLESDSPRSRSRGLQALAKLEDPDLLEWCVMFLGDDSPAVRLTALRMMSRCDEGEVSILLPLVASKNKRIRGAAIAALARHGGAEAQRWFERGLKDPEPCVRLETAAVLEHLDPDQHRPVFELALYDPNPEIARTAEGLTAGKGFHRED